MTEPSQDFKNLDLDQAILDNLKTLEYLEMTPIQEKGLPIILNSQDFIGQANAGSGKTAAFGLGILAKLDMSNRTPQALVIVPTRELADQVTNEIRRLARFSSNVKIVTLSGGLQESVKIKSLKQGAHIIVGTPGRLLKLLDRGLIIMSSIKVLVLDEADRLLEMGSLEEMNRIASFTPLDRQTLLFSATFPHGIRELSATLLSNPVQITIDSQHEMSTTEQLFYKAQEDKSEGLLRILAHYKPESCIVFCNSRDNCNLVTQCLRRNKMDSLVIHSDLEQQDRTLTLIKFANKSCRILVATDLASRGLDIKDVSMVINYDLPNDHETYIHRVGRTGRAGQQGLAVSLYTSAERSSLVAIREYLKTECPVMDINILDPLKKVVLGSPMVTIYISGGKKNGIRPADILGALTKDAGLEGSDVGKINVLEVNSYVALTAEKSRQAIDALSAGKIKGKKFKVGKA